MGFGWQDDEAEELKRKEKITLSGTSSWNFISASRLMDRIDEEVSELEGDYPGEILRRIHISSLIAICVLLCFSFNIVLIVTIPFIFLYGMNVVKAYKMLKRFGYPVGYFWPLTIGLCVVMGIAAALIRMFILKI